jgi:hypothetical protein
MFENQAAFAPFVIPNEPRSGEEEFLTRLINRSDDWQKISLHEFLAALGMTKRPATKKPSQAAGLFLIAPKRAGLQTFEQSAQDQDYKRNRQQANARNTQRQAAVLRQQTCHAHHHTDDPGDFLGGGEVETAVPTTCTFLCHDCSL